MYNEKMLNELHLEMIKYDSFDPKRIQHFCKVHGYAKLIAECEGVDEDTRFILETAALTHDIGIKYCEEKFGKCNGKMQEEEGPVLAEEMLVRLGFPREVIDRVKFLIAHHHTYADIDGIDYAILLEADFIVNIYEDEMTSGAVRDAYKKVFVTETGKRIMEKSFYVVSL